MRTAEPRRPLRLMHPLHKLPTPGQKITVFGKDGKEVACTAVRVVAGGLDGVVIYAGRKAIDEGLAEGWWPAVQEPINGIT